MSERPPNPIDALFVEMFNLDLGDLNSPARVGLPADLSQRNTLELQDDEGTFLIFIPAEASPQMAAIAYRLYGQGLNRGARAGEESAWAKLRHLIGAAAA